MPDDVIELADGRKLAWWGSDCTDCGNTTPASMRCDVCGSRANTVRLYAEATSGT